jgi:hypothetical protein
MDIKSAIVDRQARASFVIIHYISVQEHCTCEITIAQDTVVRGVYFNWHQVEGSSNVGIENHVDNV